MERGRLRRALYGLAAIAALAISGPMLPLELAVWFSGELLLYLEVVSGVWLMSSAASIRAGRAWLKSRLQQKPSSLIADWAGSHPKAAGWVQGTLAFQ